MLRTIVLKLLVFFNISALILFVLSCVAPYLDPRRWWFTGFMGLLFPYLLCFIIFFIFFWLFVKPRRSLFNFLFLLVGIPAIRALIPFNLSVPFELTKKEKSLRVMTWNIRRLTPFNDTKFNPSQTANKPAILSEIKRYNPDILCIQEFFTTTDGLQNNIRLIQEELGYKWFIFARDNVLQKKNLSGTAIFSKLPIVDSAIIQYPEGMAKSAESVIAADIVFENDTLRIYTMHLQSFGFAPKDYTSFGKIKNQQDTNLEASKNLFRKMRQTFFLHSLQADFVRDEIRKSPHPVIICGDLNDVPNSYAYYSIRNSMDDCFLERGSGFGKTFTSPTSRFLGVLPTLRIDYIFADPALQTRQFTRMQRKLSDHSALVTDLAKTEK